MKQAYNDENKLSDKEKKEFIKHIQVSIVKEYIKLKLDEEKSKIRIVVTTNAVDYND